MFFTSPNTDQRSVLRIPITKIDRERHEVWGIAAVEEPDRSGEILDYATSKPHFENWSKSFVDATNGASMGNLRAMHTKIAAGKLIAFKPNDELKRFEVGAKVIDPTEWAKCDEGVYTGFSIGGDYVGAKWDDTVHKGFKRYTGAPAELSLVDAPCIPGATFEVVKADGSTELRKFACVRIDELAKTVATRMVKGGIETLDTDSIDDLLQKAGRKKTKTVSGKQLTAKDFAWAPDKEDPETWKLPTHDASHSQNAMARFNQTEGIPADQKHVVAQHIIAAAKKHGVGVDTFAQKAILVCFGNALMKFGSVTEETFDKFNDKHDLKGEFGVKKPKKAKQSTTEVFEHPEKIAGAAGSLAKSMWDVGRLAEILTSLSWMESSLRDEAIYENDDSKIPAQLLAALQPLKQIFIDLATEEVNELIRTSEAAVGAVDEDIEILVGKVFGGRKGSENLFKLGTSSVKAPALDIFALAKAS